MIDPDSFSRTAKIFADDGSATSVEDAELILGSFVLQVRVGRDVAGSRSRQAAVLTIINAAVRAFRGGVRVQLCDDPVIVVGWHHGAALSQAITSYGATLVDKLNGDHPTICVGDPGGEVNGRPVLRATFDAWTAGVVEGPATPLGEQDSFTPAGVAAGGIAVAEAFEFLRGDIHAGRRSQGISLWQPDVDWLAPAARGPDLVTYAPSRWWIVGLGHLGQSYLWNIGMLRYQSPGEIEVLLQDDDRITVANGSTGLLLDGGHINHRKTRVLADLLEQHGFITTISERRLQPGDGPRGSEPRLALIGVDNPATRRELSSNRFDLIIDCGLGGGPVEYMAIQVHSFPSGRTSHQVGAWQAARSSSAPLLDLPAYQHHIAKAGDQCGTIELAGRSVAAAFVGATAGALVIAEATRAVHGARRYSVLDTSLRDLHSTAAVTIVPAVSIGNVGFGCLD